MRHSLQDEREFCGWMKETGNMFSGEEYALRFGVWLSNKRTVHEHNRGSPCFFLALNKFAHLTPAEYHALLGFKMNAKHYESVKGTDFTHNEAPSEIDWRKKGVVNAIKNRGTCSSSWAYSAIQAQESQYAIKTGKLDVLSEQNLVDCVTSCYGCSGGRMDSGYEYVQKNQEGKFMLEKDYPYIGFEKKCNFDLSKAVSSNKGFISITRGSEIELAEMVAQYGPAASAIDASHYSMQLYRGGIYSEKRCNPDNLDEGAGVVGYGVEGKVKFWIVRMCWGIEWGEKGYIRMLKDANNQCGIATDAIIPKVI